MNSAEARGIAEEYLARFHAMSYHELCKLIGEVQTAGVVAPSGTWYQLELQAFWDDPNSQNGVLRVSAAIDDGGIRAYFPLNVDFLIRPDGSFIGEDVA